MLGNLTDLIQAVLSLADAYRTTAGSYWKKRVTVIATGSRTTTSTSFVAIPTDALSFSITKKSDSTDIFFTHIGNFYFTGNTGRVAYAVNINGTDYEVSRRYTNETTSHKVVTGVLVVSGLPKGTYTVTLKVRIASGASPTWNMAVDDDFNTLIAEEVMSA